MQAVRSTILFDISDTPDIFKFCTYPEFVFLVIQIFTANMQSFFLDEGVYCFVLIIFDYDLLDNRFSKVENN